MAYRFNTLLFVGLGSQTALGFDVSALSTEHGVDNFIFLATVLLIASLVLALWSSSSNGLLRRVVRGPRAENLYLSCKLLTDNKEIIAHLRTIDSRSASIVTSEPLVKGDKLQFSLSSLPEFPEQEDPAQATVIQSHAVRGDPPSYILMLQWDALPESASSNLERYITSLTGGSALSPAS